MFLFEALETIQPTTKGNTRQKKSRYKLIKKKKIKKKEGHNAQQKRRTKAVITHHILHSTSPSSRLVSRDGLARNLGLRILDGGCRGGHRG